MGTQIRQLVCFILLLPTLLYGQNSDIALVPRPSKIQIDHGHLSLNKSMDLFFLQEFNQLPELVTEIPNLQAGNVEEIKRVRRNHQGIRLLRAEEYDQVPPTGYLLEINHKGITLKAHTAEAMIPGVYSLMQLCMQAEDDSLPYLRIEDQPQYAYRGLHLDVSKHFIPESFIKKYIDLLALYKFNYLHWQLTGNGGWRIQINQYPELTEKAAWRTHKNWQVWQNNGGRYVQQGTPNANGGYYTQEQVQNIVAYAQQRGITIVPEITVPGNSREVLAIYPELSCTGLPYTQEALCLGNENTFQFLKNVLDEIIQIFPSPYLHIGGAEVQDQHWEDCSKCQALIEKDSLEGTVGLQQHFLGQLDDYLESKDKRLVGWEPVRTGARSDEAVVMNSSEMEISLELAQAGRDVIAVPGSELNFGKYQSDPRYEPEAISGYLPLEKVYQFQPMPEDLEDDKREHLIGGQGLVPTDYMEHFGQIELMVFPRALALAEALWSQPENRSWEDFMRRLQKQYGLLQQLDVNYHRPSFQIKSKAVFNSVEMKNTVTLSSEQYRPEIRYTVDGSDPQPQSTLYNLPIELSKTTTIKAATFIDSARVSDVEELEVDIHKAIGKEVIYNQPWETFPAQGPTTLTNGIKGGLTPQDTQWQGFATALDLVVDFERREEISSVAMNFMQAPEQGIYFPGEFTVLISDNGKTYRELGRMKSRKRVATDRLEFQTFEIKLDKPTMARYIQIKASNPMDQHLLSDEIVIY